MTKTTLYQISEKLTGFNILDKSNLDITWNHFNNLVNSKELIMLLLAKIYSIPMIDYMSFTDNTNTKTVYEEFGLTSEQGQNIQTFNLQLLNIQKILQLYCIQQFTLVSYSSDILYELINGIPEETDIKSIEDFLNTIDTFKSVTQSGGSFKNISSLFIKILIIFILTLPSGQSDVEKYAVLQLVTDKSKPYLPYNTALISAESTEFKNQVAEIKKLQPITEEFNISQAITAYNTELENSMNTIIGKIISLYSTPGDGEKVFNDIIMDFNRKALNFSSEVSNGCGELIDIIYDKGLFENMQNLDSLEETNKKIDELESKAKQQKQQAYENVGASVFAAATTAILDPTSAATNMAGYLLSLGESITELVSSSSSIPKKTNDTLTPEQQLNFKKYAHLCCSYGYNLQLGFNENEKTMKIVGSKIDYTWIQGLIIVLEKNLETEIFKLSKDPNNSELEKLLKSTKQRLNMLNLITVKLEEIINTSTDAKMINLMVSPSKDTLQQIKTYFDSELNELINLLRYLQMQFPEDKRDMEEYRRKLEAQIELQVLNQEMLNLGANANAIINQMTSERDAKNIASNWYAFKTVTESYIEMAKNGTRFGFGGTQEILSEITTGMVNIITKPTLDAIKQLLMILLTSSGGWIVLGTGLTSLLILLQMSGIGVIKTFVSGGYKFIVFVYGNIVSIFRVIVTPFGWILEKVKILYLQPKSNDFPAEVLRIENVPSQNPDDISIRGGKKKKTRRHKKSKITKKIYKRIKKNKTRRIRNNNKKSRSK
jgi:hypothetical protein